MQHNLGRIGRDLEHYYDAYYIGNFKNIIGTSLLGGGLNLEDI